MTTPVQESAEPMARAVETCDVCAHPEAAHDAIARRYCDATVANAMSRGCICAPVTT